MHILDRRNHWLNVPRGQTLFYGKLCDCTPWSAVRPPTLRRSGSRDPTPSEFLAAEREISHRFLTPPGSHCPAGHTLDRGTQVFRPKGPGRPQVYIVANPPPTVIGVEDLPTARFRVVHLAFRGHRKSGPCKSPRGYRRPIQTRYAGSHSPWREIDDRNLL